MKIAGLEKCSTVDWPGKMAAVIFTPGCNLRCAYCHNHELMDQSRCTASLDPQSVLEWLGKRRGFLDGVVFSGGEPTLQPGLTEYIRDVRTLGFAVKLDTNGTRPDVIKTLLDAGLLDYVAMDVKGSLTSYDEICGAAVDPMAINASIQLLIDGTADYEFRTTVPPQMTETDVAGIAERIHGARRYFLQQYRPHGLGENAGTPHPPHLLTRMTESALTHVQHCATRGLGI